MTASEVRAKQAHHLMKAEEARLAFQASKAETGVALPPQQGPRQGGSRRTFTVYALADPRTQEVRYVGLTGRGTTSRVRLHWSARGRGDHPKDVWLRDLDAAGLRPTVSTLETTETEPEGREAEYRWMAPCGGPVGDRWGTNLLP